MALRPGPAKAAAPPEWAGIVAAAKAEGKVVVNTFPGDGYKRALKAFTQAYPDIKLEHTGLHSQDFAPRILQERQASLYTWDVVLIPTSTALQVLRPAGVWDPVRPAIILPEAKDDAGWEGGFERGFNLVKDRALVYGFVASRGSGITVNTDMVKDEPIRGLTDLLNPKWKGKLLLPDVRVMGDSFWPMTSARLNLGDDIIKRLFVDQEPVLSRDTRQMAEFMVRGRYPVALGINPLLLSQFQRQGLGKNLKLLHFPEMDTVNFSSTLWLVNKAPHPNAAKVFVNWLLTKEAQTVWAREVETNSRRVGVEPGNADLVPPRGAKLFQVDAEENLAEVVKTQDIAKAVIK
jgi:iron(III) transport system substrate-binding protein